MSTTATNMTKPTNGFNRWMMITITAIFALFFSFSSIAQTTINTSGTYTIPAGVTTIKVYLWGGGGAGAGNTVLATAFDATGGGGGGAAGFATINVTPGDVYTVTIGAGGIGNATATSPGANGSPTIFSGPAGTWTVAGGFGAAAAANTAANGVNVGGPGGSTGSGPGLVLFPGGTGSNSNNGTASGTNGVTGNGGGGGGSAANGVSPAATCGATGFGGGGAFLGGNGGVSVGCATVAGDGTSTPGVQPGGGGSGVKNWNGSALAGGSGGAGRVIVVTSTCSSPTLAPTALVLTPALSNQINGSFTAAGGSDSYLIVRYPSGGSPTAPSDGTLYTAGASLGAGTVVTNGGTSFLATGLTPSTTYDFYVYSMNSGCLGGPLYFATPLSGSSTTPAAPSSTALGGLWSSPQTWTSGAVPTPSDNVVIAAGATVTIDQIVVIPGLTVNGTLQWNGTATNSLTVTGNVLINPGGVFLPYTSAATPAAVPLNFFANFTNNGYVNASLSTFNFNNSTTSATLNGTGTFQGNGTDGIIRGIFCQITSGVSIATSQNIITSSFANTNGPVNTGNKLKIDNTAQVYGQPLNIQVANVAVTAPGSLYNVAPVVFGAAVTQWNNIAGTVNTLYVSGNNVYRCTAAASIGPSAPTHTSGIAQNLLWVGTTGTLGNPYSLAAGVLGTQYFLGNNLYTCVLAGTANTAAGAASLGTTPGTVYTAGGTSAYVYVGSPATATVNWLASNQTVRSLNITSAGSGYSAAPTVAFSVGVLGGTGSGATATAVYIQQVAGPANSLTQKTTGTALTGTIGINSDQGTSVATANPQASTGVGAISTTNGGVNYTVVPTVGFGGPTALNLVTNPGSGYTTAPTITVDPTNLVSGTNLTSAAFTITMNQGQIISVYLTAPGTATYSAPPAITLSTVSGGASIAWPSGCWPAATPVIGTNGQLTDFTVTNPGFGYVAAPTLGIGATSGTALGGTFSSIATTPTARVALYNLTLNFFSPAAASSGPQTDNGIIPTSRKINALALNGNGSGLILTNNLTLFASASPLVFVASGIAPGNVLDLGGNNLNFTWSTFAGISSTFNNGGLSAYVKNGSISLTGRGGNLSLLFPFAGATTSGNFTFFAGSTPTAVTTGATITRVTVTETGAPSGTGAIGTRAYRVVTNGVLGSNPFVIMQYNTPDALPSGGNATELYISQSTALGGSWQPRSASSGAGTVGTSGNRTTSTSTPGPIVTTGNDFFAWTSMKIDSANVTSPVPSCPAASHAISADLTVTTGTVTTATLNYSYNAVAQPGIPMTNTVGNTWTATIPAATAPTNAVVTWSITANTSILLTRTFTGATYQDEILTGAVATASASVNPVCSGSPTSLSAVLTQAGNPFTLGGAIYTWNDGSTDIGTGNPFVVSPLSNTNYTVTISNPNGCTITSAPLTVSTLALPNPPNPNNSTQCGLGVPTAFVTTGGGGNGFKWYSSQFGGSPIQVGGSTYASAISTTTHFWVSELDATCESLRTELIATVTDADPISAGVDNNNPCTNSPIVLTGTNTAAVPVNNYVYTWTANPASGSGIPTSVVGSPVTVTPTLTGTYTYTATAFDVTLGCTTTATVVVTTKIQPSSVTAGSNVSSVCVGGTIDLTSSATSNVLAGSTTPLITEGFTTVLPVGWFSQNLSSPIGSTNWFQGNDAVFPANSGATNSYIGANFNNTASTGTTNTISNWLFMPVPSVQIHNGDVLTFYTRAANLVGSRGERLEVRLSTNGTSVNAGSTATSVGDFTNLLLTINPTLLPTGQPGAYPNVWTQYTATVSGLSSPVSGRFAFRYFVTNGGTQGTNSNFIGIDDVVYSGLDMLPATFSWASSPAGFTSALQNPTGVVVNANTTYTVTASNTLGCSATASVSVTTNPLPPAPAGSNGTDQCGTGLTDASVSSNNITDPQVPPFFKWYLVPTGGTAVQSSTSTTYTTPISATTDFYVSELSNNGCEGPRVHISTVVSSPDVLTTTSSTGTGACLGEAFDLSSSYTPDFNNYATFTLTASPLSGSGLSGAVTLVANLTGSDPYSVTPTAPGTYTYTITAFDPDKNCSSAGTVVITVNPNPSGVTAGASLTTVCAGTSINLTSTGTSNIYGGAPVALFTEGFTTVLPSGWAQQNLSTTIGTTPNWIQGVSTIFPSHSGGVNDYALCTFNSVSDVGTISNWMFTPPVFMHNGDVISFWTRTVNAPQFADRMEVRLSTNGNSVNVGSTDASVGDYTTLLVSVNPTLAPTGYPNVWTQFTATISGLSSPVTGRIAFRYFVTNGGPNGDNSDNIGVDDVVYTGITQTPLSFSWTSSPAGFTSTDQNPTGVVVNTTTTYSVTATSTAGCSATANVTVTALPIPSAPTTNSPVTRCGPGVVTLTATAGGTGVLHWYNVASGGTSLQTGGTYSPTVPGSTSFWVSETGENGCEGPRSEVTVTVTPAPTANITATGPLTFCFGGSVGLNTTGSDPSYTNFAWSATPAGAGLSSASGSSITATPTVAGTYTVTLTADDGVSGPTGCSNTATAVITVNPNPTISTATATPATICDGATTTLEATSLQSVAGVRTIGSATTTTQGGSPFRAGGASETKTQLLYTAAELTAAGLAPGNITSIGFNFVAASGGTLPNFKIKMGNTTATALTSTFEASPATTVFAPASVNPPTVVGIFTLTFTTPFNWNGTSNLLIEFCHDLPSVAAGSGTVDASTTAFVSDNQLLTTSACTVNTGGTTQSIRPLAILGGQVNNNITNTFNWVWNPGGLTGSTTPVTPSSTTTYTVTATNPVTTCSSTATVTVTLLPVGANATATPSTPVCAGASVTLNSGGTGIAPLTYAWTSAPAGSYAATSSISVSPTVTTSYTVTVTDACGNITTSSVTVTVNRPTGAISGGATYCGTATPTSLSIAVTGTGRWSGTLSDGTPFSGSSSPISVSVTPVSTTTYTITSLNDALCTANPADLSGSATVTVNPLSANPTASVVQPTCVLGTGTINVTAPLGAGNTYSIGGPFQSSPSFPGVAPGTYTLSVQNSFGCFSPATTSVTVNPQPFTPGAPVVTGIVNVCPFIGVAGAAGQLTYTATATGNGTQTFNWVVPPTNVTIVSGQGTPTLVLSFNNSTAPGFAAQANKQIRLTVTNECGTSSMTIYYLLAQIPNTPNPIVGPTDACPLLGGPAVSYTIPKAPGAASYNWVVPQVGTGTTVSHPNGAGVNDTTILVSFLPGYTTASITVQSINDCGVSGVRSITVTRIAPSQPSVISGPTNACPYITPNAPATYTVPAVPGVTYTWSGTNGAIMNSTQGSNTMSVSYPIGYTGGTISVTASTGCGTSTPRNLTITTLNPGTPSNIDVVQTHFCGEVNGREFTYAISATPTNATSIVWTVPTASGAILLSGQGTTQITVRYPNSAVTGTVTVQASNPCANSAIRSVNVKLPACPVTFAGNNAGTNGTAESKGVVKTAKSTPAPALAESMEVKIFPNPTVSDFKLEVLTSGTEEITVRVLDNLGRLYKNFKVMPYQTIALGAELKSGSYLVEVRQGKTVKTTKVIKF
ncbi:MAG: choice-of-anchor J domain-containing protein [Ferruginibacter sp.]